MSHTVPSPMRAIDARLGSRHLFSKHLAPAALKKGPCGTSEDPNNSLAGNWKTA